MPLHGTCFDNNREHALLLYVRGAHLDVKRLSSSRCARQPCPLEAQRGKPSVINTHRATRRARQQLPVQRQAVIKQLNGMGTGHSPHLRTQANPPALVSAGNGITFNKVMKHRTRAR